MKLAILSPECCLEDYLMREVLGVQVERNDKGKVSLQFWGCFNLSARHAGYAVAFFASVGAFAPYFLQ